MTCAQGLLRLLWGGGGPKLECYGTGHKRSHLFAFAQSCLVYLLADVVPTASCESVFYL